MSPRSQTRISRDRLHFARHFKCQHPTFSPATLRHTIQRRSATHVPAQVPLGLWPRQTPPPRLLVRRPDPSAHWPPDCTLTLTAPFCVTRPCIVTMPPS